MGLLALGTPLSWPETKAVADHVREHGITQFLKTWDRWRGRKGKEPLLWGDEIEYIVVAFQDLEPCQEGAPVSTTGHGRALLSLRQSEILEELQNVVLDLKHDRPAKGFIVPTFHPEYGRYMLESTPGAPYGGNLKDLVGVENNMRLRRRLARAHLKCNEIPMTVTSYPRLGVTDTTFTDPESASVADSPASQSLFVGQQVTNPHARFPTLTANIRSRRGSKVAINVPIFKDTHTASDERGQFIDPTIPWDRKLWPGDDEAKRGAAKPDHIYMDAMAFGMGCCCLQITFQASDVNEARRVYDALVPVAPIMLAMTAASPAFRGYLADVDARWNVIAASVDDRTPAERGLEPLPKDTYRIPKSRYDSVDCYISNDPRNKDEYNDIELPINESVRQRIVAHGIDDVMARHIAHLFVRDPLVVFSERIDQDDENSMDHFENIQSTNWQTIRFKPPPPNSPIAWRVEFRSMEVQLTDFENAAYSIFIVLLTRAILSFNLNFYMPISQVDENMQRAQGRDAAREQRFHFRRCIFPLGRDFTPHHDWRSRPPSPGRYSRDRNSSSTTTSTNGTRTPTTAESFGSTDEIDSDLRCPTPTDSEFDSGEFDDLFEEMSLDQVVNGKGDFPGLMGVVNAYLNSLNVDIGTKCDIRRYLDVIKRRASGEYVTPARWIREFITKHPLYKHDSVVSDEINYDLMKAIDEIERGVREAPELLGRTYKGSDSV